MDILPLTVVGDNSVLVTSIEAPEQLMPNKCPKQLSELSQKDIMPVTVIRDNIV